VDDKFTMINEAIKKQPD